MINVFDLDYTLSFYNNTFNFIELYHRYNSNYIRLYVGIFLRKFEFLFSYLLITKKIYKSFLIFVFFFFLKEENLNTFYNNIYKALFLSSLTGLGKSLIAGSIEGGNNILLTACTQFPAEYIASEFHLDYVFFTSFIVNKNNRILGVAKVIIGENKVKYISEIKSLYPNEDIYYFSDDLQSESNLIQYVDKFYHYDYVNDEFSEA